MKTLTASLLLLVCVALVAAWVPFANSREQVKSCLLGHQVNRDGDDCITLPELKRAYEAAHLTSFQRSALPSAERLMKECQPKHSQDQCISAVDLDLTLLSSEPTCLRTWSHVHYAYKWLCEDPASRALTHDS